MNSAHWREPMSSADPAVVNRSVQGMETSLKNAALWGADAVLLVPGVVDATNSVSRRLDAVAARDPRAPAADGASDLKVIIAVEEVWNKFLLSPIEFARYVDEFDSPFVKAYFDVGNVVLFAFPQDWIRTLGPRIVKVHLKDFKLEKSTYSWKNIGEGDIDWIEVRKAFGEIGYNGYVTTEVNGGDAAYLADLSVRVDRFLAGQKPVGWLRNRDLGTRDAAIAIRTPDPGSRHDHTLITSVSSLTAAADFLSAASSSAVSLI